MKIETSRLRSQLGDSGLVSSSDRPRAGTTGGDNLADAVERARTPRTPALALTGVWLVIAAAFLIVLALVVLTVYLV